MKPAYTPGTLTVPPRRTAAMHWRSALPLLASSLSAVSTVSVTLPLASKPTASITASTPRCPSVRSMIAAAGSSSWSKSMGIAP